MLPKGSQRRWWFGLGLTAAGVLLATFVIDAVARGALPLTP